MTETEVRKIIDIVATSILDWISSDNVFIVDKTTNEPLPNACIDSKDTRALYNIVQAKLTENNINIKL